MLFIKAVLTEELCVKKKKPYFSKSFFDNLLFVFILQLLTVWMTLITA